MAPLSRHAGVWPCGKGVVGPQEIQRTTPGPNTSRLGIRPWAQSRGENGDLQTHVLVWLLLHPAHGGSDTCSDSATPSVPGPRSGHCLGDTETAVPGSGGQNWGSAEFGGWTGEACTALPGH